MVVPSSAVAVTLTWDTASGVGDSSTVVVSRWNGSQWINHGNGGGSGNNSNGSVVSSGTIASFSPFTLGTTSIINNPLPIELLSFNASLQGDVVELTWTTATEINNDFFTIERSQDGNTWEEVGVVSGAGNSNSVRHYQLTDNAPFAGQSYYRLKQTDFDGSFEYSDWRSIFIGTEASAETVQTFLYPNPSRGNAVTLELNALLPHQAVALDLIDMLGQPVLQWRGVADTNGQLLLNIPGTEYLATGIYTLRGEAGERQFSQKMIVR